MVSDHRQQMFCSHSACNKSSRLMSGSQYGDQSGLIFYWCIALWCDFLQRPSVLLSCAHCRFISKAIAKNVWCPQRFDDIALQRLFLLNDVHVAIYKMKYWENLKDLIESKTPCRWHILMDCSKVMTECWLIPWDTNLDFHPIMVHAFVTWNHVTLPLWLNWISPQSCRKLFHFNFFNSNHFSVHP